MPADRRVGVRDCRNDGVHDDAHDAHEDVHDAHGDDVTLTMTSTMMQLKRADEIAANRAASSR
eukprot:6909087-Heterocapsa_arctica.AAC.1